MTRTVVAVESLAKRYLVAGAGHPTPLTGSALRRALKRRIPSLRSDDERDWFWALRDVSFELRQGEVLGIIGRNGAGKSTLLKLLAGIVVPSAGRATMVGRVGSLLEIGTGFHPDLSGRDNVMLAAALLGISRSETLAQFEAIVDYAGVGHFIDVPVKRYSSGMYMRLAYAVTALLRSDILLLDEVLAVGDAEFQKKTKQHVDNLSLGGRTVLFVSHSMSSVNSLCSRCIWLDEGRIVMDGSPEDITNSYLETIAKHLPAGAHYDIAEQPARVDLSAHHGYHVIARDTPVFQWIETCRGDGSPARCFDTGEAMRIRLGLAAGGRACDYFSVAFHTMDDHRVTAVFSHGGAGFVSAPQQNVIECVIPELRLVSGDYMVVLEAGVVSERGIAIRDSVSDATQIRVSLGTYLNYPGLVRNQGFIAQKSQWRNQPDMALDDE